MSKERRRRSAVACVEAELSRAEKLGFVEFTTNSWFFENDAWDDAIQAFKDRGWDVIATWSHSIYSQHRLVVRREEAPSSTEASANGHT